MEVIIISIIVSAIVSHITIIVLFAKYKSKIMRKAIDEITGKKGVRRPPLV